MPTECERNVSSAATPVTATGEATALTTTAAILADTEQQQQLEEQQQLERDLIASMEGPDNKDMLNGEMSTSQTSNASSTSTSNGHNGRHSAGIGSKKVPIISPDPTAYVTKARVTRPTPPPPSYNPMQFVQIKPCNLYQTAQEQLKKAEEVKKIKEIKKEEPEDWQNNLDNWKSSRRKRVEHIIDRVVEVKKLELEEHDRSRRKSKTFSEMIEERGERPGVRGRAKLASLAVYNEDETNDLSDLGIGNSSASGKSSLSEDYDNNSVMSDNVAELDKAILENTHKPICTTREYISSPGYDTSSSTAPASSPDPCEYTYEGAIQDYKQRVSRATLGTNTKLKNGNAVSNSNNNNNSKASTSKESTPDRLNGGHTSEVYPTRRGSKIEDRLIGFEVTSPSDSQEGVEKNKVDVPKIDISKRKEIFESQQAHNNQSPNEPKSLANASSGAAVPRVTLRDRFKLVDAGQSNGDSTQEAVKKEVKRLSGDITSIRDRLQSLEQQQQQAANASNGTKTVDVAVLTLKERLSCLQNAVTKEEIKRPPVVLVDARQLEIMKNEEETAKQRLKTQEESNTANTSNVPNAPAAPSPTEVLHIDESASIETGDADDSGIHTMADDLEQEERLTAQLLQERQEQQLNAAIAALAMEEQQLEQAANAVNQIEAEFAELTNHTVQSMAATAADEQQQQQQACDMEFSINEALELALQAIDKENQFAVMSQNFEQIATITATTTITNININAATKTATRADPDALNQNKTDEEKEIKSKIHSKSKMPQKSTANRLEDTETVKCLEPAAVYMDEEQIAKEPIYENISATTNTVTMAAYELNAGTRIIPNANSNLINNNNIINNSNNSNQNKLSKINNINSSNNNNLVELTNVAFANTTTTTATTIAIAIATTTSINNANTITTNVCNPASASASNTTNTTQIAKPSTLPPSNTNALLTPKEQKQQQQQQQQPANFENLITASEPEPYYQVPKSSEPYYDAPKHLRPVPLYENIDVFYTGFENAPLTLNTPSMAPPFRALEPPKEKPPPPPIESPPPFDDVDSVDNADTWSSDNTYETISSRLAQNTLAAEHPSPPIKRMNSTKRIKKELRHKRSSFLGIEGSPDDDESYLELTVAPPPDMAQLLQEERRLEKQLYMKAGLCDSSDTGESRDSGVSENHSRQSSEHYTNSSEENDNHVESPPPPLGPQPSSQLVYQSDALLTAAQTPLLQTVKGNSAESWTESATVAAAATKSLTEATATATAKMLSIEEKIREQEEVLRVERELLQLEQEELKRQRESLMLRENMARRELQHGAKMLMSANRHSLQDLNALGALQVSASNGGANIAFQPALPHTRQAAHLATHQLGGHLVPQQQQIYANVPHVPNLQQQYYHQVETDYRKSMSDLNEFSKRLMLPPTPPTKPMRTMHVVTATTTTPTIANGDHYDEYAARQRHSLNTPHFGGSLVKIANAPPTAAPRGHIYSNFHHQSAQNLTNIPAAHAPALSMSNSGSSGAAPINGHSHTAAAAHPGNMSRNTLHALSATPKPKYTDGWVQVQNRKSYDSNHLANDPAWLSAYQQKRKSMPDAYNAYNGGNNNHWLVQEAEQRRIVEQQRRSNSNGNTPVHQQNGAKNVGNSNGKPLPDAIIQTLTERVQSKGIGERKRFDGYGNNFDKGPLHAAAYRTQQQQPQQYNNNALYRNANNDLNPAALPTGHNSKPSANNTSHAAATTTTTTAAQDKVLSVSGKKKCSHCGDELGRGAAMIIESLLLFYHINCFKCCVCHVQLGDGLNGTDVRVRNHKLHCQNCYSSDDGIKFSCV